MTDDRSALKVLKTKVNGLYREPRSENDYYRLGRNDALDDVAKLIVATIAEPPGVLPVICATAEDVIRAAPVDGAYWVRLPASRGRGWRMFTLKHYATHDDQGEETGSGRSWDAIGAYAQAPDDEWLVGAEIVGPIEEPAE